jgi:hypothetical protein
MEEKMTNADHIRAMTDEELVEVLCCPTYIVGEAMQCGKGSCRDCREKWLKQPYEGGEDDGEVD